MVRVAAVLLLAGSVAACAARAPVRSGEIGEAALTREHFDELDSAVAQHRGASVEVEVQRNVGADAPVHGVPSLTRFPGQLVGTTDQHLLLLSAPDDTAHIGKGNVVGIYLQSGEHGPSTGGVIIGAVILGAGTALMLSERVSGIKASTGTRQVLIPASVLIGGVLGAILGGDQRRGTLIYPPSHGRMSVHGQ